MSKPEFICPPLMRSHVARVFGSDAHGGEYESGVELVKPRVLDIGANLGAFSIWAARRWPGCGITAWEPHPDTFRMLCKNVGPWPVTDCRMQAVSAREEPRVYLYDGAHNCGEASLLKGSEQAESGRAVDNCHASKLPPCDVLKIDAEGVELEVLRHYPHMRTCKLVLLEAHGRMARNELVDFFETPEMSDNAELGWHVAIDKRTMPDRWTLGYRRTA
jgi:FkbM family methyltransferase